MKRETVNVGDRLWMLYEVQAEMTHETSACITNPDGVELPIKRVEKDGMCEIRTTAPAKEQVS